tara:strand:- start:3472 stop:4425 length:954 start_codon:yes stop_codon:yes gene_type:complete
MNINKKSKIFITGHKGLVGSSIYRKFKSLNYKKIIIRSRKQLDLTNQKQVETFFKKNKVDAVINAAAKVGGIAANNKYKADFLIENIQIQNNIVNSCFKNKVKNLILLGSSCIYPKNSRQPMLEKYLLTGKLEETNDSYAIAKIVGVKLCEAFNYQYKTNYKCLMPSNLYGPNDNYHTFNSHFLPAIIKKMYLAKIQNKKKLIFWGTGNPKRELTYVDDIADACVFFLNKKTKHTLINIGSGHEYKIKEYIKIVSKIMGLNIRIKFNNDKLKNGHPRKILNCSIAKSYGWKSKYSLKQGLNLTLKDFFLNKKIYLKN